MGNCMGKGVENSESEKTKKKAKKPTPAESTPAKGAGVEEKGATKETTPAPNEQGKAEQGKDEQEKTEQGKSTAPTPAPAPDPAPAPAPPKNPSPTPAADSSPQDNSQPAPPAAAKEGKTTSANAASDPPSAQAKDQTKPENMAPIGDKTVVFVVGGPGCGKGTQCAKIVDKFGFCHLSSGDLLRAEVASGSERGKSLNAIMESGQLVSLDVVLTLLKEAMLANSSAKGFLIDGYPRELEQGTRFESEITAPKHVLYFEVSDDTMKNRLLERAKTSGRVDDNEETIAKRLTTFHEHTQAVIEHYEKAGLLRRIDAAGAPDAIFEAVVPHLSA